MNKLATHAARVSGLLARNVNKNVISASQRCFSERTSNLSPAEQQEILKQFQASTGAPEMPDATVTRLGPDLEKRLLELEAQDPYDIAASNPEPWKETPTPDGWLPGENDPTFVMPSHTNDHRPDLRKPESKEVKKGNLEARTFQTETRQMLDIVTNSLYTDKEVFLRELVSNASDALEKARYVMTKEGIADADVPFEIRIFADEESKTITIQDTGIGMTAEELVSHLGTIARSGSKQWVREVKDGNTDSIIGQFGVGFYSGFMVGEKIEVYSRSAKKDADGNTSPGQYWISDGTGSYEMCEAEGVERGTKIIIHLRENATNFAVRRTVETILKKYSNFVGYPIYLNGVRVNTIQAIWNMSKNEVTEEQHAEFYRYIANAYDAPVYRMHFNADVPLQINALFYFPERHMEKYGMGRMDPGTSLYSRKVLIKSKAQGLLPDYFRFVQGVVDSEDVPLNISRENMQDSLLISRISSVLTKRIIKHLQEEAKKNVDKYNKWYNEFCTFLKEGVCSDFTHKTELARLLRFDSSAVQEGESPHVSLDDYISRMPPSQQNIYFLCAPNRRIALASPYYESLKASGHEVLFLYHPLDDFVMKNLREYSRRKLISAEASTEATPDASRKAQMEAEHGELIKFIKDTLGSKVATVTLSDKVTSYPAFVVDHESASMRKMMKMMDTQGLFGEEIPIAKQKLTVNPNHAIFVKMMMIKDKQPALAKLVVEQVFDNALMAADILDNPRAMLPRMHKILESALDPVVASSAGPQ